MPPFALPFRLRHCLPSWRAARARKAPPAVDALLDEARELARQEDFEAAIERLDQLLEREPNHALAHYRRGTALFRLERHEPALESYARALAIDPALVDAHYNQGLALQALKRPEEAIGSYDRALALKPDDAEALNNKGHALFELRRHKAAIQTWRQALALRPDLADAHFNCGVAWQELKRPDAAAQAYEQVLQIRPDYPNALGRLLHARMLACDWRDYDELRTRLDTQVRQGAAVAEPFGYLASATSSADLRLASQTYGRDYRQPPSAALWRGERYRHERIRIGYLCGEFRHQATSQLIVELIELHDKQRFELFAFDAGWPDDSAIRRRLEAAFDHFVDVAGLGDAAAARAMREREIDIAVDLNGYFGQARPGVLARRPCPVQVNYLGYPGTLGAPHMDYILADATAIPRDDEANFDERVICLPDTYQANDARRVAPECHAGRAAMGLPEQGFVFCCFNNNFKITPQVFSVWMRLLQQVDNAVLWLLKDNDAVKANLTREAERRGVAADRLVWAQRLPSTEHLARHRLADLFLDTLPCNAHTTASDALWMGLPLLTCRGSTFPGRVAASLLGAVGLPELVAESLEDYERTALELAASPARMLDLRRRLERQRLTHPLFDTPRLRRHVEAAYQTLWERAQRGEAPTRLDVAAAR